MFSYQGKFHSYKNVSIWPRPVQQPHPPIWTPITASKELIEFAAKNNIPITPGESRVQGCSKTSSAITRSALPSNGHKITPKHLSIAPSAYIADIKAQAVKEAGPICSISTARCSVTAMSPRRMQRGMPAMSRRRSTTTSARKT